MVLLIFKSQVLGRGGREALEGEHVCVVIADSHCCTAKTNTVL